MNMSYQNVLERLKEERLDKHLSQLEMGQIMRMSQSHYSKAELGRRRFPCFAGRPRFPVFGGARS